LEKKTGIKGRKHWWQTSAWRTYDQMSGKKDTI